MSDDVKTSFEALFFERRRALYALALQRIGHAEDAQDAVQETFAKCMCVDWEQVIEPDAMLTTIHLNVIRDMLRRKLRRQGNVCLDDVESGFEPTCNQPNPEQCLASQRKWAAFSRAVDTLPPVCRRIFVMCKIDNLSHSEIKETTGMSQSAIEKNVVRALQRLRKELLD